MAGVQDDEPRKGWGWLRQVQSTTQQLGQICTEGVGEAKRRLEENRPGIDQFVKNIGDNMQQGVKKVQEQQPGLDQLVRNIGDNVQKGVKNIQENLVRDPWSSPPTAAELASLDLVYVKDRVIAMGFPVDKRSPEAVKGDATAPAPPRTPGTRAGNDIDLVAALLRSRHAGHYMVWNVSEEGYDYSLFQDQVLEFRFPGHPAPPLGMLFKMCTSIESWLLADPKNVAAVHCLTGRGRTSTVLACYLAWVGEVSTPSEALEHVATCKGVPMERLTIPSQRRYLSYFSSVMEGVRPRSEPLLLRRVIMNTIPTFGTKDGGVIGPGKGAAAKAEEEAVAAGGEGENGALGCCPYIQVFKGGSLIFTATYRASEGLANSSAGGEDKEEGKENHGGDAGAEAAEGDDELPWAYTSDDSISFPVDCVLQGDLLVRCRHLSPNGRRVSMFRAAFHTGYVPSGVLRLTKQQLDGACADGRFHQDFFLDLIFAPVETTTSSSSPKNETETETETEDGKEKAAEDASAVDGSKPATEGEGTAAAPPPPPPPQDDGNAAATVKSDAAAGAEGGADAENSAVARREGGLVVDAAAGEAFDSMLHRDARFWGEIAARKERRAALLKEREEARARGEEPQNAIDAARAKAVKHKEAAAAAAAMAGGTTFSIDEDEATQAGRNRWGANSAASSGANAGAAPSFAGTKPAGGITDDDLLAQLAEAEMEQDDVLGAGGDSNGAEAADNDASLPARPGVFSSPAESGKGGAGDAAAAAAAAAEGSGAANEGAQGSGGGTGGVGAAPPGQKKDSNESPEKDGTAAMMEFDDAEFDAVGVAGTASATPKIAAGSNSSAASGNKGVPVEPGAADKRAASAAAATGASNSLEDELSQLEELEKELGIMGVVGDSAGTGEGGCGGDGGGGAAEEAAKDDGGFDMDNLDELEGYLESLAK